jgi:hypothetical protein
MKFLLLLASLVGGVFVAWLSILGGIWYVAPFCLIAAGFVAIALDKASRWRIAAFSLGMIAVYALEANSFVRDISEKQARAQQRIRTEPAPTPRPRSGLFS